MGHILGMREAVYPYGYCSGLRRLVFRVNRDGTITGMLSVNATSGQVWLHTWHGTFLAHEDA